MRLDRLITLSVVRPFRRALRAFSFQLSTFGEPLPILMYHSISDDPEPGVHPYYRVCTSPRRFAEQMRWLADHGYRGVALSEALSSSFLVPRSSFESSNEEPKTKNQQPGTKNQEPFLAKNEERRTNNEEPRLVALTFDDGFRDFYTEAFPILQEHGFSATVYLPTAFIGTNRSSFVVPGSSFLRSPISDLQSSTRPEPRTKNDERRTTNEERGTKNAARAFLSWDEVRELHQHGIEFGSHTVNHPKLVDLTWDEIELELRESKLEIEKQLAKGRAESGNQKAETAQNEARRTKNEEPPLTTHDERRTKNASPLVTAFAYPYAYPENDRLFIHRLTSLLGELGYQTAVTTRIGQARCEDAPFCLRRFPVNDLDDPTLLKAKLAGDYDWLSSIQGAFKRLKRTNRHPSSRTASEIQLLALRTKNEERL